MTYDEFLQGKLRGTFRLIGDENGGPSIWYQITSEGTLQSLGADFVPPSAPAPFPIDNPLSGFSAPLTSNGVRIYATTDLNPANEAYDLQTLYLATDPNRPARAEAAFSGQYVSDNSGTFDNLFERVVLGGLAAIPIAASFGTLATPALSTSEAVAAGAETTATISTSTAITSGGAELTAEEAFFSGTLEGVTTDSLVAGAAASTVTTAAVTSAATGGIVSALTQGATQLVATLPILNKLGNVLGLTSPKATSLNGGTVSRQIYPTGFAGGEFGGSPLNFGPDESTNAIGLNPLWFVVGLAVFALFFFALLRR